MKVTIQYWHQHTVDSELLSNYFSMFTHVQRVHVDGNFVWIYTNLASGKKPKYCLLHSAKLFVSIVIASKKMPHFI